MSEGTKFHGVIGDMNPIDHDGGVVYQEGDQSPQVVYFQNWSDEECSRVTVSRFCVEDNVLEDLTWVDWGAVASSIGMEEEEFRGHAVSDNVLARAQVYESVAGYCGFINLDGYPLEMTREEVEDEYGTFVDEAHAAGNNR